MIRLPQSFVVSFGAFVVLAAAANIGAQEPPAENPEIAALIRSLESGKEPADRAEAAKRLHEIGHHTDAQQALPVLRRLALDDPDAAVRAEAVKALAQVAFNAEPRLCPIEVLKAWADENEDVRGWARTYVCLFALHEDNDLKKPQRAHLEPGAEALLLKYVVSEEPEAREQAVMFLPILPEPSEEVRAAVMAARDDKHFNVRNSAHIAYFRLTDKLTDIFPYYVRAMEELPPPELSDEGLKKLSKKESSERIQKNLILLGIPILFVELASDRQEEAAAAMKALLRDKSADTRRQAAVFLGRFGFMVGEEQPMRALGYSPWPGEGEFDGGGWMWHLLPYLEKDDYGKFLTPSLYDAAPGSAVRQYVCPSDYSTIRDGTSNTIIIGEDKNRPGLTEENTEVPSDGPDSKPEAAEPPAEAAPPAADEPKADAPEPQKPTMAWLTSHGLLDELRELKKGDPDEKVRQAAAEALKLIDEQRELRLPFRESPFLSPSGGTEP